MGFWSGIKHALNSTLGTDDFKPLDKLIENHITNNIRIAASDVPIKVLIASQENIPYYTDDDTSIATFKALATGTVRIKAAHTGTENGTTTLRCAGGKASVTGSASLEIDVDVTKGTTYTIYMTTSCSSIYGIFCTSLRVCGNSYFGKLIS